MRLRHWLCAAAVGLAALPAAATFGQQSGVATGGTVRASIIGAVLGDARGQETAGRMDRAAEALRSGIGSRAQVARVGEGMVLVAHVPDPARLSEARPSLRLLAGQLARNPDWAVLIVGHTSSAGEADRNMSMSYRTAEAAKEMLVQAGVSGSRIRIAGRGATEPVASNADPAGRRRNARLEIGVFRSVDEPQGASRTSAAEAGQAQAPAPQGADDARQRLARIEDQARRDPAVIAAGRAYEAATREAMGRLAPEATQREVRLSEIEGEAARAQAAGDNSRLNLLAQELREIQGFFAEVGARVEAAPEVQAALRRYREALLRRMSEIDPTTPALLQRLSW